MQKRKHRILSMVLIVAMTAGMVIGLGGCGKKNGDELTITNVSYDPTREFYEKYNVLFEQYYEKNFGKKVRVIQSHGGSGSQARSVVEGCNADVVTLALEHDITLIEKTGLIDAGWQKEFDKDSAPYTSTIVFLVRKGNQKQFMKALYQNVSVMDSGARGATTTFVENKKGDVLIAWENEALATLNSYPGEYEMINPSVSILAQPSVAVVDDNAGMNQSEEVSTGYLQYLYSDEAQRLIGENGYRPSNEAILQEFSDKYDLSIKMWNIGDYGGWDKAYETYFDDGAMFDEIYEY